MLVCVLIDARNVMSQRDDSPLSCTRRCAARLSGQPTFRYRSLLKLNCIINASRTISDGLYGNLRPRERPWKFEKGLTNTSPCPHRSIPIRLSPSVFSLPPSLLFSKPLSLLCFAGRGIYTINSLICRAHVGFRP